MQIPADEPDPVNANQYPAQANPPATNAVAPITLKGGKTNIYDDPLAAFVDGGIYKVFIFLFTCISGTVIIFLRYRIGLRLTRMWVFAFFFLLAGGYSFIFNSGWLAFLSGSTPDHAFDLAWFSFAVLIAGHYRNSVAKELVEHPTHPLHTMARGNSYLARYLSTMPRIYGIEWRFTPSFHLTRAQWFPLSEPAIQRWVEPILLAAIGGMLVWNGNPVGGWLAFSAIALSIVESDYHIKGENHYYNMKDEEIEGKVLNAMHDPKYAQQILEKDGKIGGIAVVSDELRQRRQRRLSQQN